MDNFVARGHEIITDAMRRAKESEAQAHRSTAVSTHVEHCLRQLWSHMTTVVGPETVDTADPLPTSYPIAGEPGADDPTVQAVLDHPAA